MPAHKTERVPALFGSVVEPLVPADGDTVVVPQPLLSAGWEKMFSVSAQQLL